MRLSITSILLLATGLITLAGSTSVSRTSAPTSASQPDNFGSHNNNVYNGNTERAAQEPLQVGSMPPSESPRHRQEKAHLMKRIDRKRGKWNTAHPRYRLLEALYGFAKYRERQMVEVERWRGMYRNVGKAQKRVLEKTVDYEKKLDDIEELLHKNEVLCKAIVSHAMSFYGITRRELDEHIKDAENDGRLADRISTSQTLKHFVRDWTDEGSKERDAAYPCILSTLSTLKESRPGEKPLRILLPGAGVGRLGTEVAGLGAFEVTLNEWSMYMNIGYRFVASRNAASPFTFHPFVDALSHHKTTQDLLRPVAAPDVSPHPAVLLVEGDFTTAFKRQHAYYDVLMTHFFIDTARNLMSYFDTIHRLLKPGGRWMNLGPLLYGTGPFVQLSLDEIVLVVEEMGFVFEDVGEECGRPTFEGDDGGKGKVRWTEAEYGLNGKALTRNAYKAQVWVVRKL